MRSARARRYPLPLARDGTRIVLDPRATVAAVVADLDAGVRGGPGRGALPRRARRRDDRGVHRLAVRATSDTVALSGGVFQNRVLLERVAADLRRAGLRVLIPERLPPNDGGISYGQAAVAAAVALRPRGLCFLSYVYGTEQQSSAREDERWRETLTLCPVCLHCSR